MAADKKSGDKKAAPPKAEKTIPVFSRKFMDLMHQNAFKATEGFQVSCNVDGILDSGLPGGTFPSLDEANDFAAQHRKANPGHRLTVSTTQSS
jgi:hypothetical protein